MAKEASTHNTASRSVALATAILTGFAVLGTGVVATVFVSTQSTIAEQQQLALLESLNQVIPASSYDNELTRDTLTFNAPTLNKSGHTTVYRARLKDRNVAAVLSVTAPDGYNGDIKLLVGIRQDGTLTGVRTVFHKETPGLGDAIDAAKSDWIYQFDDTSLTQPSPARWNVKKDGGHFDQLTGATITPRAVVGVVKRSLEYFRQHKEQLFAATDTKEETSP